MVSSNSHIANFMSNMLKYILKLYNVHLRLLVAKGVYYNEIAWVM